jgi:hypothetical protein
MKEFSKHTVECLTGSGWTRDSVIDTRKFEEVLKVAGFTVHDAALNFWKEYGGHFHYPHAKVANMLDEMHFDPLLTIRHIRRGKVNAYAKVVGRQLCPIGEAARGYLVLMMNESGEVYASYDDFFAKVAASGSDTIEALCSGRDMEPIPLGQNW